MGPHLLHVDLKELKKLEKHLEKLKKKALPYATKDTVNSMAFEAQRVWKQALPQKATLRNAYTQSSIRVDQAKSLDISTQQAVVGSIAKHVALLERGQKFRGRKKHGAPVPTLAARGGQKANLVRKPNSLAAIKFKRANGRTRSQKNAVAVSQARKQGKGFAFLESSKGTKGIFAIGKTKRSKLKKLWDLSKKSIKSAPRPTMPMAASAARARGPGFYREALIRQLKFHRIMGY